MPVKKLLALPLLLVAACGGDATDPSDAADTGDIGGSDAGGDDATTDAADSGDSAGDGSGDDDASDGSGDDDADADVEEPWTGPYASLRVIHVSPTAPAIDVWLDGVEPDEADPFNEIFYLETGPELGQPVTYIDFPARPTEGAITVTGEALADAVLAGDWNFSPLAHYTVFVYGQYDAASEPSRGLSFNVLVDDTNLPVEGASRLRIINASPALPTVDVKSGDFELAPDLIYGSYTFNYVDAEIGTYALDVLVDDVVVFSPELELTNETLNVFIVGDSIDDLALVTLNQANALTLWE